MRLLDQLMGVSSSPSYLTSLFRKDLYCYRVKYFSVNRAEIFLGTLQTLRSVKRVCSLFSVRTWMLMYAKVTYWFLPNFLDRSVWVEGSWYRNWFFDFFSSLPNLILVRLWNTYRVHFCQDQDHDEINPIGMYDSSNESSQRTE